jgi:cytochrome bd-type quinol oxidase subunit 2
MCFSAPVSFAASGLIGATGIATYRIAKGKHEIPFASIPLIFALHQFLEGIMWSATPGSTLRIFTLYFYLMIAVVLWPIATPIFVYFLEKKKNQIRKKILAVLIVIGSLVSLISFISILGSPVSVSVVGNSLSYTMGQYDIPQFFITILQIAYAATVLGSMMISGYKFVNVFGLMMTISFIITYVFLYNVYFSVWCFFTAILSGSIYYFFKAKHAKEKMKINEEN